MHELRVHDRSYSGSSLGNLNHRTGRLDPSYAAIAAKVGVCDGTVAAALQRLKALGILGWVRRCAERRDADGRFVLEQ